MAQNTMKASEVNVGGLTFSDPDKFPSGGTKIFVNNDNSPLYIQTPKVKVLWDTEFYAKEGKDDSGNYPVTFALSDMENNPSMKAFHDCMISLDERIVNMAFENRKAWFGPKLAKANMETIQQLYKPLIKIHTDKETGEPSGRFPPSFKLKVIMYDGKHQCKVYDENKVMFNIDDREQEDFKSLKDDILVKGTGINVLLKCKWIWVTNLGFGCTWSAEQIKVKIPEKVSGYAFRDDDDEDNMDVVEDKIEEPVIRSDSDSESESDSDEEPVVKQKPVKKRGVKKQ
jgi:hypothetical protein